MTILNNGTRNQYIATAGQTVFVYNFEIFQTGDIRVYRGDNLLAFGTDYSLSGVGNENGGSVTLTTGADAGDVITIFRKTAPERLTDFQNSGDFLAQEINNEENRQWAVIQELITDQSRFLQVSELTQSALPVILEDGAANNYLRWNDDATSIESVAPSQLPISVFVATDFNIHKNNFAAVKLIDIDDVVDGQGLLVTDVGQGGAFRIRNVNSHGLSDDNGNIIVIDNDWYAERISDIVDIRHFGGRDDSGVTDNYTPLVNAATYLLSRDNPRGTILFPSDIGGYYEISAGVDFHDILFTQQGLSVIAAGHILPNGTSARDVKVILSGDGVIKTTSAFSDSYLFKFGEYQSPSLGQSMKFEIGSGLKIIGPGSFGNHAATTFVTGSAGYTSTADALKGTDNTVTTCVLADNVTPSSRCLANIQGFNKGIVATYGFGLAVGGSIQYCNVDVQAEDGFTNLNLLPDLETEVAGVGLFLNGCDATTIISSISEANVCNFLLNSSRFMTAHNMWFEGGTDDVIICCDATLPSTSFNRQIHFEGSIGPANIDCRSGIVDLKVERSAVGTEYRFNLSANMPFRKILFDECTYDSLAESFDMNTIVIPGGSIATWEAIYVEGETINNSLTNYPARGPITLKSYTQVAPSSAQKAFDIIVPNALATARIEIIGYKKSQKSEDMQIQTLRYVGVLQRFVGEATVVEFSTTESATSNYNTTGANAPVTIATPTTTITGAVSAEQTVSVEYPTGTAVSNTAETLWHVSMLVADGDLTLNP